MVGNLIEIHSSAPSNNNDRSKFIGYLPDALSCNVVEERNGTFDLSMTYPIKGKNKEQLVPGAYICCKVNVYESEKQFFRIVEVQSKMNGEIEVTAHHISYDLIYYITGGSSLSDRQTDITPNYLWNYCVSDYYRHLYPTPDQERPFPFTFNSDLGPSELWIGWNNNLSFMTVRFVIGGDNEESMQTLWPDGEFKFNNYSIEFNDQNGENSRGKDRGVTIRYGKNMTELSQTLNNAEVYDGVMPIWSKENEILKLKVQQAYPDTMYAPIIWRDRSTGHNRDNERLYLLDLSDRWDERPMNEQLLAAGLAWLKNTDYSENRLQLTVSFFNLTDAMIFSESGRYNLTADEIEELNRVELCDTVTVYHPDLGILSKTKVVKTDYNVLTDHYNSIDLGEISASLATSIGAMTSNSSGVANVEANKAVKDAIYRITEVNWLSNTQFEVKAKSSYRDTDADASGAPDEVTNVYSIETDGNDIIFDNTTTTPTDDSIYFKDWPTMSENNMAIVPSRLYPTYFGTKVFGRALTTGDNYQLEGVQFQSICRDTNYVYIAACDDQDTDGCIIRMNPDGSGLIVGPKIANLGHAKIMIQGDYIYASQRKLGPDPPSSSWNAKGMHKIQASNLTSVGYYDDPNGAFPHIVSFVQNGNKNYYINDALDKLYEFEITDFENGGYNRTLVANLPRPHDFYDELTNGSLQTWTFDGQYITCIRNSPQFAMIYDIKSHATRLAKIGDISDYRNLGEIEGAYTYDGKTIWLCANDTTDPVVDINDNQMGETYITFWYMCMTRGEAGSLSLRENMHPNHNLPHNQSTTRNICIDTTKNNFYCDGSTLYPFHCLSEAIDRCNKVGDYAGIHFQSDFTGFVRAFNKKITFTRADDTLNVKLRFTDIRSCEFICDGIKVHDCEMYHSTLWVVNDSEFSEREFDNYFLSQTQNTVSKLYNGSYRNNMFRYSTLYVRRDYVMDERKANDIFIDSKIIVMDENDGHGTNS